LVQAGITHIFNVSDAPNVLSREDGGFQCIHWHSLEDLTSLSSDSTFECLSALHRMVIAPDSQIYIHCMAGQNRSATILWLYLIALGIEPDDARRWIVAASLDAVPGHSRLSNLAFVEAVTVFGRSYFQPHPRPEALSPMSRAD